MKITLCGSLHFMDRMLEIAQLLHDQGHEVKMPPEFAPDGRGGELSASDRWQASKQKDAQNWVWDMKEAAMRTHFEKVEWADVILIVNEEKNGIPGYIGANTLLEMGVGFYLGKPVYLLNPVPELDYKDEILGMKPIILNGNLEGLNVS